MHTILGSCTCVPCRGVDKGWGGGGGGGAGQGGQELPKFFP